jgi:galactokinase
MKSASEKLGVKYLRETSLDVLNDNLSKLNEEEIKKSTHFFLENERVDKTVKALIDKDLDSFLKNINESCLSSEKLLNNTMLDEIIDSPQEVIDYVREINPAGAVKINGGGFKGTVIIYIHKENYESVKEKLLAKFDKRVIEVDIAKDDTPYLSVEEYLL